MSEVDVVTVNEAAEILATTPTAILMLMRRHELTAVEVEGSWQISRSSVKELIAGRRPDVPLVECRSSCAKAGNCSSCGPTA